MENFILFPICVIQALSLLLLSAYYKFLVGFPVVAVAALLLYVGCYQVILLLAYWPYSDGFTIIHEIGWNYFSLLPEKMPLSSIIRKYYYKFQTMRKLSGVLLHGKNCPPFILPCTVLSRPPRHSGASQIYF